jgi:hypothetical protein
MSHEALLAAASEAPGDGDATPPCDAHLADASPDAGDLEGVSPAASRHSFASRSSLDNAPRSSLDVAMEALMNGTGRSSLGTAPSATKYVQAPAKPTETFGELLPPPPVCGGSAEPASWLQAVRQKAVIRKSVKFAEAVLADAPPPAETSPVTETSPRADAPPRSERRGSQDIDADIDADFAAERQGSQGTDIDADLDASTDDFTAALAAKDAFFAADVPFAADISDVAAHDADFAADIPFATSAPRHRAHVYAIAADDEAADADDSRWL